jgi:TrmH family RNA methyltransferase
MGAIFTVPAIETDNIEEVVAWARTENLWLIATSAHAEKVYWGMGPPRGQARGVMLLMGSERHGLPADVLAAADEVVTIPMSGSVTSLNLAVATALLIYELKRGK